MIEVDIPFNPKSVLRLLFKALNEGKIITQVFLKRTTEFKDNYRLPEYGKR